MSNRVNVKFSFVAVKMVKSPTWQLARIYIYTLPFANLDMILGKCLFARVCGVFWKIDDFYQKQKIKTIILVRSTKWWVTFISKMKMQSRKLKKKENRFDIFLGSLSLWNLRKLKLDNQALLLAAWFLRGFPKRNREVKYLIYRSLVVMVHNPHSPPKKSRYLAGFFVFIRIGCIWWRFKKTLLPVFVTVNLLIRTHHAISGCDIDNATSTCLCHYWTKYLRA